MTGETQEPSGEVLRYHDVVHTGVEEVRDLVDHLDILAQNPTLNRRLFLGASGLALTELASLFAKTAILGNRSVNNKVAHHAIKRLLSPTTTVPTTTTIPPTTTTQPPTPPTTEAQPKTMEAQEIHLPPERHMPYGEFARHAELMLLKIPKLDAMHERFPGSVYFADAEGQRKYIAELDASVNLDVNEFKQFAFNTEHAASFSGPRLDMKMAIWHWTGRTFVDVNQLVQGLRSRELGVQAYTHSDAQVYQLVQNLRTFVSHCLGLNLFAAGMEVHSGDFDGQKSPLFGYQPNIVKEGAYGVTKMLIEANLPVNKFTFLGHYTGDLIFMNPYYNPMTGEIQPVPGFDPPGIRKYDPPQEFMDMIVPKAERLYNEYKAAA